MTFLSSSLGLSQTELRDYGVQRARDAAFDAIRGLWQLRRREGLKQVELAGRIDRDPGWVSTCLSGPRNWTMRTLGEFAAGLDGEIEIRVVPIEKPNDHGQNYDAYADLEADEQSAGSTGELIELKLA